MHVHRLGRVYFVGRNFFSQEFVTEIEEKQIKSAGRIKKNKKFLRDRREKKKSNQESAEREGKQTRNFLKGVRGENKLPAQQEKNKKLLQGIEGKNKLQ
ncbi:hypothetical protein CDAR_56471 [Caerostris darwini]|uniref:Uncharacterized protein n=1 Tax=Caerostris darwini TaxID=1538125 RepID=A0AAV4N571_9ARAC|nr:hypothetical protein CDAR_56471 [Caerostris darwini]